jgi:hypothetical protein
MITAQTSLLPHQEQRMRALSPDDRARFDEIAGFLQYEMRQDVHTAEWCAFREVCGPDDKTTYGYPAFASSKFSRHSVVKPIIV